MMIEVAFIALVFLAFSLLSQRLEKTVISGPMFFMFSGILLASNLFGGVNFQDYEPVLLYVGVIALGLSFFNDASRITLTALLSNLSMATRLLLIGLPLTFIIGILLGVWLLPELLLIEAALVAIILTPADTGLITVFLSSPRVPKRIRQALNVESSLNDGLTTPIAAILIELSQMRFSLLPISYRIYTPLVQILVALAIGFLVGGIGGRLLRLAVQGRWIVPSFNGLVFPSLTVLALSLAHHFNGNYFIACFIGGVALSFFVRDLNPQHRGFAETLVHLLSLVVFMFLGVKVVEFWATVSWSIVIYALLSILVARMLPITIAMLGMKLRWESILCLGWFGPRGLASIVLATIVVGSLPGIPHAETIVATVVTTVALSVILHGVSAIPLIVWYGRRMENLHPQSPEFRPIDETPIRMGSWHTAEISEQRVSKWEDRRMSQGNHEGDFSGK